MNTMFVLAVPRIVVGLLMVGHGLQKLAGWFGGPGLSGTASLLDSLRIRRAPRWAFALGLTEILGGAAMAVGLFEPLGQLAVATVLLMAIVLMHWRNGPWNADNGFEFPLVMATVAIVSAAAPAGPSLDAALGISLPGWAVLVATIGLIAAALYAVMTRRPAQLAVTLPAAAADTAPAAGERSAARRIRAVRIAARQRVIRIGR